MCNELVEYMLIRECSCERFEFEWNTKILRQLCNVSLNASSSYRPKYFVSPNFERSFCIVYATRWSLVTLLKIHLVHFCGPPGVHSNFIYIYYILTDSHVRATVSCCSIKCFLTRMVEITIIIVTIMITIIILITIMIIRVTIVTFDVRPVTWSSPLMITGQANPKKRDRKVRTKVYARVYASVCRDKCRL